MSQQYNKLVEEIQRLDSEVKSIWDAAGDEPLDSQTWAKVKDTNKRLADLEAQRLEMVEQAKARDESRQREIDRRTPVNALDTPRHDQKSDDDDTRTIGERVLSDPQFKAWRESIARGGNVTRAPFGQSPAVGVKLLTGASATSAGALFANDFQGLRDLGTGMRPLTIRDVITVGRTDGDTVEYARMGTLTNNAAPVAEATATSGGTGVKPESDLALSVVTESVKTIAHWLAATRRSLADAGQLRTLIDTFLRYGLEEELEDQIINGAGTGENFTGLLNITGTTSQAWDTSLIKTTRKARTLVRTTGRATPTAYVLNPTDWESLDLAVDSEARYYFGGPMVMGTPRLWGLPVIESEGMPAGTGMVADFRLAVLWVRENANILTSDSHSDFFIRNLIAILAEMRAAFGVLRPAAFVEIDTQA
jgi:HK97 family phage major capsid protein